MRLPTLARPSRAPRSVRLLIPAIVLALLATACIPLNGDEKRVHDRINALRGSRGVHALQVHDELVVKARHWSDTMTGRNRLSHSKLDNGISAPWRVLGEIVGVGSSVDAVFESWARSPAHRDRMLDRRYSHVGVGVATGADGRKWVTVVFMQL